MAKYDAAIAALLDSGLSNVAIGQQVGCSEYTVRQARKRLGVEASTAKAGIADTEQTESLGSVEVGPEGGEFKGIRTSEPLTDWTHVFQRFNLDPDSFEIVGDTVRVSHWQQSARTADGDRDIVNLYSYRARFRRKTEMDDLDLPALYAASRKVKSPAAGVREDRSTVVVWSDPQIGKTGSRGGTEDLLRRSFLKRADLSRLLKQRKPSRTVLLDGGDGIEGFESGGNPMFLNDLSLSGQLDVYGTEMLEWVKTLHEFAPVTVAGVPSNHAQWRNAKQTLGKPSDDLGLFMHRQVRKVAEAAGMNAEWVLPADYDESVAVDVLGTRVGLVHGNQFGPGQAVAWWEKQTFGAQAVAACDILCTAHYHSFGAGVAGRNPVTGRQRWWLGAPTLDNASDWYRNVQGRDSDPGVLVFDVTADGFDLSSLTIL